MKKEVAFRKEKSRKRWIMVSLLVIIALGAVTYINGKPMLEEKARLEQEIVNLETQVSAQETRAQELKQFEVYTHTKKYAEEIAKEVLGYVYEGEIIFRLDE